MPMENNKVKTNNFYLNLLGAKLLDYLSYMNKSTKDGEVPLEFVELLSQPDDRQGTVLSASIRNIGENYQIAASEQRDWMDRFLVEGRWIIIDRDASAARKVAANIDTQIMQMLARRN